MCFCITDRHHRRVLNAGFSLCPWQERSRVVILRLAQQVVDCVRKIVDTTLQAIVSERTVIAPSILVEHGEHREGPYVLITITSDVSDLPYRFFTKPTNGKLLGASQGGEVWVRHSTSKRLATADEVEARTRKIFSIAGPLGKWCPSMHRPWSARTTHLRLP